MDRVWNFTVESLEDVLENETNSNYQLETTNIEPSYIEVSFNIDKAESVSIDIYNIFGDINIRLLESASLNSGINKYQIPKSNFSSGIYFIIFRNPGKTLYRKFSVVN